MAFEGELFKLIAYKSKMPNDDYFVDRIMTDVKESITNNPDNQKAIDN